MKGAKTKVKNKAKKDKKKNQNSDVAEQKDAKPKVDEFVVSIFSYYLRQLLPHNLITYSV